MKTLTWKGDQVEIPAVGLVEKGSTLTVDDKRAQSYIDQGLAKLKSSTSNTGSAKVKTTK